MEEELVLNGSHEPETEGNEKILKPRKPKNSTMNSEDGNSKMQNGSSESGSVSDLFDDDNNVVNGHDENPENNSPKPNGIGESLEKNMQVVKEQNPKKGRSRAVKESTPKPETPIKRELRRRETTPRGSTPKKQSDLSLKNPSHGKLNEGLKSQIQEIDEKKSIENGQESVKSEQNNECKASVLANTECKRLELDESVTILNESNKEDIISVHDSVEVIEQEEEKSSSIFSVFRKGFKNYSPPEAKNSFADSTHSPSVICLNSPNIDSSCPSPEVKARKPINSFSKFPGRTVSITSLDRSIKRKADSSFDSNDKKRFAGDIENVSEKSPGWRFYASWSPARKPRSTPLWKRSEEDSMAVNYDEDTNLSFSESETKESQSAPLAPEWWCSIM